MLMTSHSSSTLLTVDETAALLGVHPMTVRRKIRSGEIPALRLGGPRSAIRVDAVELERWLRSDESAALILRPVA